MLGCPRRNWGWGRIIGRLWRRFDGGDVRLVDPRAHDHSQNARTVPSPPGGRRPGLRARVFVTPISP